MGFAVRQTLTYSDFKETEPLKNEPELNKERQVYI